MSFDADALYRLLPAVHRLRDAQQGEPLRALMAVFADELTKLDEDLDHLYDDQFIETCADWVAPYIGDLIGWRALHGVVPKVASPRAEIANTIAYRRRKGTALMLEQLARDVTDWPARAVEFFERLATTQHMRHARPQAPATADLRDARPLFATRNGAFDTLSRSAELRRPEAGGRWNVPNVGLFVWRLLALPLTDVPLTPDAGDASGRRWRLNPLGADVRLFRHARTEDDIAHLAEPANVPEPLSIRAFALAHRAAVAAPDPATVAADDYGPSVLLLRPGNPPTRVPTAAVRIADLADLLDAGGNVVGWNHENAIAPGTIALDPERGRVVLGAAGDGPLVARFHVGAVRGIGGGEYEREPAEADGPTLNVDGGAALQPALDAVTGGGRVLIDDSLTYAQTPSIAVDAVVAPGAPGLAVVVAAANPARPLLQAAGDVTITIGARGTVVVDGLVVSGGALRVPDDGDTAPRTLRLRDCTLVPGRTLNPDGNATAPGAPSLIVEHPFVDVVLERCICGPLQVVPGASVILRDCIVDAGSPEAVAYDGDGAGATGADLSASDCTVIGKVRARQAPLIENTILHARLGPTPGETWPAPVVVDRRQAGCVRFCFVPADSLTPPRYRCVPDRDHPDALPQFTSLRYGDAAYAQLRATTGVEIREGASDGSEIGIQRPLAQPQREANLRTRLDEYLRLGLAAGIFHAT